MNRAIFTVAGVLSASSLLLVDSAVKGTVLLALAAVVALILRRDSAATRHLVWLLAIVAMLVVPVLSAMLPQWRVLPAWMSSSRPVVADVIPPSIAKSPGGVIESPERAAPVEVERPSTTVFQPATALPDLPPALATPEAVPAPAVRSWNWINALPLVWVIGFAVLMLRLSAARWMLWNSERLATVIGRRVAPQLAFESQSDSATAQDPIVTAMAAICSQLGIGRPVTLLIHPHKTIPVVWGILRCRLMLPAAARQWSDEQLQSVLLHELAHIKRRDTIVQLLAQVACALHWFNPLVWFAAWRLDVERERSCDDLVLASGIRPSVYAGHLLDVVTGLSPARWTQSCGLAMARKSSLEGRLTAVLGKDLNRRDVSVALAGLALAIAVGIAVPIAMLRAADEKWNPHQAAHIGTNDFSAYCVHGGKDASFVIAYHGDFGSATESVTNPKTRTWTDSCTITAKKPGIALSFHRTHTAPGKLSITTAPAEGRDLSKPAPPPRKFGQREYDLTKGRVFLLSDSGDVRQLDIATPDVTDHESAKKLAALIAAIPPQDREDVALTSNHTDKLAPETIAKLKWGEPVNGLRMALAWPPSLNDPLLGDAPFFQLVVQNVSEKVVRFSASNDAPNPRELNFRADNRTVLVLADKDTAKAEWHLQPGHCGVLRMFTKEERADDGKTVSAGIEGDLSKIDRNHAVAEMEVVKAPEGAWTGKLVTGQTRGSADVAAAPAPMHKDAHAYYEVWQRYARANGDIPGALVGELAASVKTFIRYNPTWETVPKLNELLPRLDATRDWKSADAIALLDEVAGIQDSPLKAAPWKGTRHTIRKGDALPKRLADAPWGEAQPNGLRAAWVLEPAGMEHRLGAALKARLLVQNTGRVPVVLQVPTFHQGGVKATDAKGADVQVSGISWTTLAVLVPVRLGPGEFIEIYTPGVGLGPRAGMGPRAGPRVGSNVLAKAGDELTLTHGLVPLDGSEVGVSEDDPHVSGPGWWLAHIQARLNRELPLPADATERTRLLDRAVRELFAIAPSAEEAAEFIADKTPDALDALAKRLAARVDVVSFCGKLPTAPAKFRVLAADANADKQPRVVLGPGEFREEDAKRPGGELMEGVLEPSKPADRGKEPLVLGVRSARHAQWRIGGTAKVGLVVRNRTGSIGRNHPGSDVKFSYTGRLDNGLSVVAVDEAGKEHAAAIAHFDGLLTFQQMLLPVAHVATIKEFTIRFDAEKRGVSEPHVAAFHLPPGKYKLRCKWNDARPDVAHEGEWTGELVNEEFEFTLDPALEKLATGKLERVVHEAPAENDGTPAVDEQGLRHKEQLQGSWQVVEAHVGGTHAPRESSEEQVWKFTRDKLVFDFGDGDPLQMAYRIDEKQVPATIDLSPLGPRDKGNLYKGIYELDGDQLKVHFTRNSAANARPTEFNPSGIDRGMRYFVLKRTPIPVVSPEEKQGTDAAAPFRDKLAELDARIAALKMERVKLSETLSPKHPNIRKLDAEVEALEEARASFVATNPQALSPKPPAVSSPLLPPPVANPASVAQPLPEFVFARRDWSRPAKVAVGDGVTVAIHEEVINRADIMATARIRYTAADGAVTGHDLFIASDAFGSRAKWAYGWVRDAKTFWFCSISPDNSYSLHRVSFVDPHRITDDFQQYYPGEEPQRTLGVPDAFYSQLVDVLGFQKWTVVDKSNGLPEISGQNVVSAQPMTPAGVPVKAATALPRSKDKRWKVQFVDAATGQPVSRLRATVTSRTADGLRTIHVMKVVSDGAFERNLNADEHAWVSVVDEAWTNADDDVRLFGNVPADAQATEKHTNPDAPFIVKVKPRVKQAKADEYADKPAAKPTGANMVKLPNDQYVKSGVPVAELNVPMTWSAEQNGLCLGMHIPKDADWRIGKEVKVELWIRNPGDKDAKFENCGRNDQGLRVLMTGKDGKEHEAGITDLFLELPIDKLLLPPAYAVRVREFSVVFPPPESKPEIANPVFTLAPSEYRFRCEHELVRTLINGPDRKPLGPPAVLRGDLLRSVEVDVKLVAADAPAPKPRITPADGAIRGKVLKPDGQGQRTSKSLSQ